MANQMIALQARVPRTDILGGAIQRNAQMMNMMAQQNAAQRQAEQAQQTMRIQAAQEERAAALAKPQMEKAGAEAGAASLKTAADFYNFADVALGNARTPEEAVALAGRIARLPQFQDELYQGAIRDTLASMPQDPSKFPEWKQQTHFRTLEARDQLAREIMQQNLGTSTRVLSTPKFGGGPAEVVPGSEAQVTIKPTVVNVEGLGPVIVDPNTGRGYPAAAGPAGGYSPPGLVAGPRGGGGGGASALATNPGAIKDSPFARSQPGYTGAKGGFATFASPEAGIAAQENLLRGSYIGKGFDTINKIVDRYAPAGAENSAASVANYKQYIAQRTGIDPSKPITAAQVPAVAAAMREFETGQRPGTAALAPASSEAPQTVSEAASAAERRKTAKAFERIAGIDFATGKDPIHALIMGSTSGGAEQLGAAVKAFIPESIGGGATKGMENIAALSVLKNTLMKEMMPGGRLSTGVSDEDRRAIEAQIGNIDKPEIPASARLRAWYEVLRIMRSNAGITTQAPKAAASASSAGQTRQIVRTGKTRDGRKVVQYSDGSIEYGR